MNSEGKAMRLKGKLSKWAVKWCPQPSYIENTVDVDSRGIHLDKQP